MGQEFINIHALSQYLGIKASTLYTLVEARSIPFYRVGRLIRFKAEEIDLWMESNRRDCIAPEREARRIITPIRGAQVNIDRVVKKAIEGVPKEAYNPPHGKTGPSQGPREGGS